MRKELTKEESNRFSELDREENELLKMAIEFKGVIINKGNKETLKRLAEIRKEKMALFK